MTALVPQQASRLAGADTSDGFGGAPLAAASGPSGDTFPAGPNTYLRVKSTNAATVQVTVTPAASGGPLGTTVAPMNLLPVVPATTGDRMYGPFPQNPFGDVNGNVTVTCVPFATVYLAAYIFPGA